MNNEIVREMTRPQLSELVGPLVGELIRSIPSISVGESQALIGSRNTFHKHYLRAITEALWDNPLAFDIRVIPQLDIVIGDGHYDHVDSRLFDFPVSATVIADRTVHLFPNYEKVLPLDWPTHALAKRGFRMARIEEIAAFGATYPDVQRKFHLFALGSQVAGISPTLYTTSPCGDGEGERYFFGKWVVNMNFWEPLSAFLAVKEDQLVTR